MLVRTLTLAAALAVAQLPARAAPVRLQRTSPFYRAALFVPPSPATYAAPGKDAVHERRALVSRPAPIPRAGQLPNQRVGPMRERLVRDICIGC